jgi:subtilase-type serine protease
LPLLARLPDAASVLRAASQTLPSNVGASAIRGSMASVNRVIAARVETGRAGGAGVGSGVSSGEAGDRQVWLMPFESRTNQGDRDGESGFSASTWGMATGAEMELGSGASACLMPMPAPRPAATPPSPVPAAAAASSPTWWPSTAAPLGELSLAWQADVGRNGNRLIREMRFGGLNRTASSRHHLGCASGRQRFIHAALD